MVFPFREVVIFLQEPFIYTYNKDYFDSLEKSNFEGVENKTLIEIISTNINNILHHRSIDIFPSHASSIAIVPVYLKCCCTKNVKNKEEVENQIINCIVIKYHREGHIEMMSSLVSKELH